MISAQAIEPEDVPDEVVAMVAVSTARTFGELAQGIAKHNQAMREKFRRVREIDAELNI